MTNGKLPSELNRQEFVETFGGIFEHSAWIAEQCMDNGLNPAADTAIGLHNEMTAHFQAADHSKRLKVLLAHPDLAGKLAAAKRLTAESTSEQASAGLNLLTDVERTRFTELNTAYTTRFGFPFIIAVKGLTKDFIMSEFERRISNAESEEFETACQQVEKIALLRLKDILP